MIFSLSDSSVNFTLPENFSGDVICFFSPQAPSVIQAPSECWFTILQSSLRLKRDVILLESHLKQWPELKENQRWQYSDGWICLQPRALNAISEAYPNNSTNIGQFRQFLSNL